MAIVTLVLGNSGSGKSFSMQNLDPSLCGVINVMGKPLPFRAGKDFRKLNTDNAYEINERLPTFHAILRLDASIMGKHFTGLFIDEFEIYNGEKRKKTQLFAAFNQKRQTLQEQKDQAPAQRIEVQMERLIGYSQKSEKEVDAQMSGNKGGYNNQRTSQPQGGQQNNGVTYQRGTPAQQGNQGYQQSNNAPSNNSTTNGSGPVVDDMDIPF